MIYYSIFDSIIYTSVFDREIVHDQYLSKAGIRDRMVSMSSFNGRAIVFVPSSGNRSITDVNIALFVTRNSPFSIHLCHSIYFPA